jgi:hypothetical protein
LQQKKNRKFAVSVFVCNKQMEAAVLHKFRFPLAKFRKHREMETWRFGDMETWRHEGGYMKNENVDMETWKQREMES